jgi:UDP-N-acetylmuramoyl-tripeptide--D-alanyl-D-alanine ligase
MHIAELYKIYLQYPNVQTDTRKIKMGELFFALKGDNFNGNTYALKALELGAAYAIVDEDIAENNPKIIQVANVLSCLQELAAHHRDQLNIPVIAITGSNGKTTTKELMHVVLSSQYKTYTTEGNLNNHIGVPLTILKIRTDAQMAIIEMGANHQKEIASYCQYAKPNFGIINNCGKAHLEGFGGVEGIRKGKGELYDYIRTNGGTIFINGDYDYLETMSQGITNKIYYGTKKGAVHGIITSAETDRFIKMHVMTDTHAFTIASNLVGDYNAPNILAAACIGNHFNIMPAQITQAIESYAPSNSRSQLLQQFGWNIILDAYNANPSSMELAIENFAKLDAPYKVVLLGAMKEMGEYEKEEHQRLVDLVGTKNFNKVLITGKEYLQTQHNFEYAENSELAKTWLQQQNIPEGAYVLVKGSRGSAMEKAIAL